MESFTITCEICQFSVTATTFFVIDLVILLSFYNFAHNNHEYLMEWKLSLGNIGY